MMGSNDIETAQIDCITEHVRDIKDKYSKVKGTADATEKETQLAKWFYTEFAEWLDKVLLILSSYRLLTTTTSYLLTSSLSNFFSSPSHASTCLWWLLLAIMD